MATWTTIANSQVDVDSPVTVSLMTALRDNPEAIAEGAANAPKIQSAAMGIVLANGTITTAAVVTITDLGRVDTLLEHFRLRVQDGDDNGATGTYRYRTSTDGGSSWSGYTTLRTETYTSPLSAFFEYTDFAVIDVSGSIDAIELSVTELTGTAEVVHVTLGVEGTSP